MSCPCPLYSGRVPAGTHTHGQNCHPYDDSSNDTDWVRDMRIILIAAQKNYVLDAPLGDGPIAGADADVMNV